MRAAYAKHITSMRIQRPHRHEVFTERRGPPHREIHELCEGPGMSTPWTEAPEGTNSHVASAQASSKKVTKVDTVVSNST